MTNRELPELSISTEKICFIIAKAEEFDAKDVVTEPNPGSNPTDDGMLSVLEDHKDDPVVAELAALINAMTEDEQVELVTLTWLGRGDGTLADWDELRAEVARVHNKHTARYLLGHAAVGRLPNGRAFDVRTFLRRIRRRVRLVSAFLRSVRGSTSRTPEPGGILVCWCGAQAERVRDEHAVPMRRPTSDRG